MSKLKDELRQRLVKGQMAPELVERAADCWIHLIAQPAACEVLAQCPDVNGQPTTEYAFFQGFAAGYAAAVHHN